jgi:hypothetical protein
MAFLLHHKVAEYVQVNCIYVILFRGGIEKKKTENPSHEQSLKELSFLGGRYHLISKYCTLEGNKINAIMETFSN